MCYDLFKRKRILLIKIYVQNSFTVLFKIFFVKDDYEEERQTNLSAVIASLQLWERKNIVSIYGGFEAE